MIIVQRNGMSPSTVLACSLLTVSQDLEGSSSLPQVSPLWAEALLGTWTLGHIHSFHSALAEELLTLAGPAGTGTCRAGRLPHACPQDARAWRQSGPRSPAC